MKSHVLTLIIIFLLFSINTQAQNGELKGEIIDADNNEPVSFANVIIQGTTLGATSNINGGFVFTNLKPGYIKLIVSFIGYKQKVSQDILISNTSVPYVEIKLEQNSLALGEVVVKNNILEKKIEAPLSMQSIGIKQIESNPGSNRDISRVIQSFPGVGSTPAFRNDVIIRGGGPSESKFFLDEVEIPVLNHFSTQGASGGPVGIINADFIKSVDFYSGSFPANRYNSISGVFNFKQKEGSHDKTSFQVAVGASETSFTVDGPVGNKTSYIISLRRSYLQFLFSAIGLPFLPTFNDYQFKVTTNFDVKNKLTIISIGSLDHLTINNEIEDPTPSQEYTLAQIPVNNQWSYTIGGVYKHFGEHGYHTLVLSRNMLNNSFFKYPDNNEFFEKSFDYKSSEIENKLRYEYTFRSNGIKYNFSTNVEYAKYYNSTTQKLFENDNILDFKYKTTLDIIKYGVSVQASKRFFNESLLVSLGLRGDANNYNKSTVNLLNQFSPRLSLSYALTSKTAINTGVGRYYQQPSYTTLGYRDSNAELVNEQEAKFIGADHINLGLEHRFNENILMSVEGFYKSYFQYPIDLLTGASLANEGAGYNVAGTSPVVFSGKGRATGFEVLNRINYNKFNMIASYTFVRSSFTDINNNFISSLWDSRYILTITSSKEFKNNWQVGLKWRYVGGLPYTPYDIEKSVNIKAWDVNGQAYLDYSNLNTQRFDAFHQLDIRVDKNFFFKKWTLMVYLDIQNAYNFKNTGKDYVIRAKGKDGKYLTTNNGTEYILESIENKSGTILPTVGIMIAF